MTCLPKSLKVDYAHQNLLCYAGQVERKAQKSGTSTSTKGYYNITCHVPGPFPCRIPTRRTPIYRQPDGGWPAIPAGCAEGLSCRAEKGGVAREWKRVIGYTQTLTQEEGIVWIVGHEAFHFLRRTPS
jgi:hypothetical protein